MTLDEAINKLDIILTEYDLEMIKISEELAINAQAIITRRIQQEGLRGRQYSHNKLPTFFFNDRQLNGGGLALLKKHEKKALREAQKALGEQVRKNKTLDELEDGISYYEWRKANGLQVSHVDLTFTGRMFQNIRVLGNKKDGDIYVTYIGGFDEETKKKIHYNAIRFGDFFSITPDEKVHLNEIFYNRMNDYLKKMLK